MAERTQIRRALLSVYDKTGLVEFARALHEEFGIELISTGGTAKALRDAGLPVTLVEQATGFPELMDGRVKTLHPKIHAAILADRDNPEHMRQLAEQGIEPIDMVVVNLYPFEKTIAQPGCTFAQAIEMIDIGGPCLLRAAAKNHRGVIVVPGPDAMRATLAQLRSSGGISDDLRRVFASMVYQWTAEYDTAIRNFLRQDDPALPALATLFLWRASEMRYGENPGQRGGLYVQTNRQSREANLVVSHGDGGIVVGQSEVEMSFNNYADASAAFELCAELSRANAEGLWHRLAAGATATHTQAQKMVDDELLTRRNLPHIQYPGATYFVTFRLRHGELSPTERDAVLETCIYWHGRKLTLHAATIMPDHVHLLLTPHELRPGEAVSLSEILHSIKAHAARKVNRLRDKLGPVWMDESFDRVLRDEQEFIEKWEYIEANAVTAKLVQRPEQWRWFWKSETGFGEQLVDEKCLAQERESTHRLEAGATGSSQPVAAPAICFIKHTNACGSAVVQAQSPADEDVQAARMLAYRKAYLGDCNAAMGGILAVNFPVDAAFAEAVMNTYATWGKDAGAGGFFVEVWLAPAFDDAAVELIRTQKAWGARVRLLAVGDMSGEPDPAEMDIKRIAGGVLMQTRDLVGLTEEQWQVVTERQPTAQELNDLRLAWLVCKHTKSNAITICKDGMLLGNGAGQMSRVMSCRVATWAAKDNGHELQGAVAASDAFFPFRDGPDLLAEAGITAIIQPGGSKRDADTIAAANERGLAMVFTGTRHFRH